MALVREQVVQTAEKYVSRGKIEPAIREYRKLLAENPNDINTLNRIGDLYARINRIDEAVDFFFQIADRYTAEGFFVKAIAIYKKIIKLDPTRLDVYEKLAELYHRQGLVNEARTQYQVLADYYVKHANAASAIAIYQKMADVEPSNPTYHVRLAEIYREQQLVEKARFEYQIIAELMLEHDRPQEAAQVYEKALDLDASDLGFIRDAVERLRAAGFEAGAARFLAAAVERNPEAVVIARQAPPPPPAAETSSRAADLDSTAIRQARRPAPPPVEDLGDETVFMGSVDLDFEAVAERRAAIEEALAASELPPTRVEVEPEARSEEHGEFELDLDDVFVLELEDEDEPASLVKPPPDMADPAGRPAWALTPEEAAKEAPSAALPPEAPAVAPSEDFARFFDLTPPDLPELTPPELPDLDLEGVRGAAEEIEIDFEADSERPLEIDADLLERTASEVGTRAQERDEDLVSEAEVLAKYGLEEKALERLREAIRMRPGNLAAYGLIAQILMEKGRRARVVEVANEMAAVAAEVGDREHWPRLRKALLASGYWIEGDRVSLAAAAEAPPVRPTPPAAEPEAAPVTERNEAAGESYELPEIEEMSGFAGFTELEVLPDGAMEAPPFAAPLGVDASSRTEPPSEAVPEETDLWAEPEAWEEAPLAAPARALPELDFDDTPYFEIETELPSAPPPEPPPPQAPPDVPSRAAAVPVPVASPPAEIPAPAAPAPPAARRKPGSLDQMLEGLLGKPAKKKPVPPPAAVPPPSPPPAPVAQAAPAAPPPAAPAPAKPALFNPLEIGEMIEAEEIEWGEEPASVASDEAPSLDDTGMSWLDEADRSRKGEGRKEVVDQVFDDEDDFFDLAAELEQELSKEELFKGGDGALMPSEEQSLEEIVEGFKRGVAEHLSATDYDTHFNLGIAYREMGLLDEAIGEFQLAAKDPGHLVLCCSMLGLCFHDKGMPELAAKWYRKGLEAPGIAEEDHLGLLYDLGNALDAGGDRDGAYKVFVDLYGINSNYRDVVARVTELEPGR